MENLPRIHNVRQLNTARFHMRNQRQMAIRRRLSTQPAHGHKRQISIVQRLFRPVVSLRLLLSSPKLDSLPCHTMCQCLATTRTETVVQDLQILGSCTRPEAGVCLLNCLAAKVFFCRHFLCIFRAVLASKEQYTSERMCVPGECVTQATFGDAFSFSTAFVPRSILLFPVNFNSV